MESSEPDLTAQCGLAAQDGVPNAVPITGTPWSVRQARGARERPALEIYEAGDLVAVMVATAAAPQLARGARRASRSGCFFGLAWGRLPADGSAITVTFTASWLRRLAWRRPVPVPVQARVMDVDGSCWLAVATGRFDAVVVAHRESGERLRLRAGVRQ